MSTLTKVLLGVGGLIVLVFVGLVVLAFLLAESGFTRAVAIDVGECFADFSQFESDGTETSEVSVVDRSDCAEPHALEAYYVGPDYEGYDAFPGNEEVNAVAVDSCQREFERFVGFDWESSELDFWWLTPTAGGWDLGDRELVCLVGDYDKELVTGTLENAGR